jgi:hypothetical protein
MVAELDLVAVTDPLRTGVLDVALTFAYDYVRAQPDSASDTEPNPGQCRPPAGERSARLRSPSQRGPAGWLFSWRASRLRRRVEAGFPA